MSLMDMTIEAIITHLLQLSCKFDNLAINFWLIL